MSLGLTFSDCNFHVPGASESIRTEVTTLIDFDWSVLLVTPPRARMEPKGYNLKNLKRVKN